MGSFFGGGVASSAAQGATSTARDPAVRRTGSDKGTQKRGSSPRPPSRKPTQIERTAYNVTGNIARDLTMGLSTFGQSGEKQAETLRSKGYSDDVIKDYQERTAASQERMRQSMMRSNDDNDSSPAPVSAPAQAVTPRPQPTDTVTPTPPAPPSAGDAPAAGSAEEAVVEGAKTRKGRASTIKTGPSGLIAEAKTRRRRSLMGGGEQTGLIS